MPLVTCILFLTFYYGICAFAVLCDGGFMEVKNIYKELSFFHKLICKFIVICSIILTYYWIKQNHFIYFWDHAGYWNNSIERMNFIFNNTFINVVDSLINSINNDDYNNFLPTIIALPMKFFGFTFLWYVLINHIMFLIPAIFVQALTSLKLVAYNNLKKSTVFLISIALGLLFPANYYAMYRGYIDVAILLPMSIAFYLLIDYDFYRLKVNRDIAIALMLIMVWISRRYTVYFVIGYVMAFTLKAISFFMGDRNIKRIKCIVFHYLIIGGLSLSILLLFFRKFFLQALFTDFGDMYSAYNVSFYIKISELISSFGFLSAIVVVLTGMFCFICKICRINFFLSLTIIVVETFLFWHVQEMDWHHRMMINVPLFSIYTILWNFYGLSDFNLQKFKGSITKIIVIICSLMLVLNFYKTYIPFSSKKYTNAFFASKYTPMQRWDIDKLEKLAEYLNNITIGTNEKIYVVASGVTLNCDILRKLYMPFSNDAVPNMYNTHDIDLRDGFPPDFLNADYIVATSPTELHRETGQDIVSYLSEGVQDKSSYIGRHFKQINEFGLDNDVTVKVYKKISDWEESDLEKLRMHYDKLYPEHEEIFRDRIILKS